MHMVYKVACLFYINAYLVIP